MLQACDLFHLLTVNWAHIDRPLQIVSKVHILKKTGETSLLQAVYIIIITLRADWRGLREILKVKAAGPLISCSNSYTSDYRWKDMHYTTTLH